MRPDRRVWRWAALLLATLATAAPAQNLPGGLSVTPVRVDLAPGVRAEAVTLVNNGAQRKTIEVQVLHWSQSAGEDVYTPTTELLANPPLFFLGPGASQIVRIGRPAGAAEVSGSERAYRVYFNEVPGADTEEGPGLKLALRIGIPVFVAAKVAAKPQLHWSAIRHADDSLTLRADNRGQAHARVADLRVLDVSQAQDLRVEGFRYVLPGAHQSWQIRPPQPLPLGYLRLSALTEQGRTEFELVPARE